MSDSTGTHDTQYFYNTDPSRWDIIEFLEQNSSYTYENCIRLYLKVLAKITSPKTVERKDLDGVASYKPGLADNEHAKSKAEALLLSYNKQGADGRRAREWRDRPQGQMLGPIFVSNSSGVAVNGGIVTLAGDPKAHNVTTKRGKRKSMGGSVTGKRKRPRVADEVSTDNNNGGGGDTIPELLNNSESSFETAYKAMRPASKWLLPSGAFAEDILFKAMRNEKQQSAAHSWIIDVHDAKIRELFLEKDWMAIVGKVPEWPENNKLLGDSIKRFLPLKTPNELREILEKTSYLPQNETYNREKHYDLVWADLVMRTLLLQYEDPDQALQREHLEVWYDIHVWGIIVDRCLQGLRGIEVSRRESNSVASADRKNRNGLEQGKRKQNGRRFDCIIKTIGENPYEFCAVEAAGKYEGEMSKKWHHDSLKLIKVLHDMLSRLERLIDNDDVILRKLCVTGIICAGLHCQILQLNYADGYTCVLSRTQIHRVPATVQGLPELLALLLSVQRMKTVVRNCKATIDNRHDGTELDSFEKLMKQPQRLVKYPRIPFSCDTEPDDEDD
ncbi:hypothetical protein RUND412_007284 [Rhizina undulata]